MPKRTFRIREGEPLLDIVSYGRGGPRENGGRLTPEQVDHIRRTIQRVPEVVVKVLRRDSNDLKAVGKHLDYVGRYGELELETDDGERLHGRIGRALLDDWDLDIDEVRRQGALSATKGRKPPKLIHKLMFSMPPGTPPGELLAAVRKFAQEQFAFQHRYAFVLHTDEAHPHVHLVLKAVSEQGVRLNIRKATLRYWRLEFARNLRLLGVPANATDRAVRGETGKAKKDGIYRASLRGDSTYIRAQAEAVAAQLFEGNIRSDLGKTKLTQTRREVVRGWQTVSKEFADVGDHALASDIHRFVAQMPPARTEGEVIASGVLDLVHDRRSVQPSRSTWL